MRDANLRKNKLRQKYLGPYFICRFVGDQELAVELSLDGKQKIVRSIKHICPYQPHARMDEAESFCQGEACLLDPAAYPKEPFTWSAAVPPSVRRMLEELMAEPSSETAVELNVEAQLNADVADARLGGTSVV